MVAAAALPLPGVYFLPKPRAAPLDLPALDTAGLVGLATRGPRDLPVPIEDLSRFDAIFGGSLAVARNADGTPVYAYLRGAVARFFSSGGTRCYVVRIAGANAKAAAFPVPGMVAIDVAGTAMRARLDASSPGRWGDTLGLGTILTAAPLPPNAFVITSGNIVCWDMVQAPKAVEEGDMLRLTTTDERQWLFPVATISPLIAKTVDPSSETHEAKLFATRPWRITRSVAGSLLPGISTVERMTLAGTSPLQVSAMFTHAQSGIALFLRGNDALKIRLEDVLLLELGDGSRHALAVADARAHRGISSLPVQQATVTATEMLCLSEAGGAAPGLPPGASIKSVEVLEASLRFEYGDTSSGYIDALGFNTEHPRFWGDIAVAESGSPRGSGAATGAADPGSTTLAPGDATRLYADLFGPTRVDLDWTDARLLIVAASLVAPAQTTGLTYLPVGMPLIGSDADLVGPDEGMTGEDDLGTFDAGPFLDPALVDAALPTTVTAASLLAWATDRYFMQDIRLKGIHALLFVDEVALIAVPDALHLGWGSGDLQPPAASASSGTAPSRDAGFADCGTPPVVLTVDPSGGPVAPPPDKPTAVTITGSGFADPATVTFNGLTATGVNIVNATTLTCNAPQAKAPGAVAVTVSTTAGSGSLASGFFYWLPTTAPVLPDSTSLEEFSDETLQKVHISLIALCQARADAVAVLALPFHYSRPDCLAWLQRLRQNLRLPRHGASFSDAREIADLSYAAVYHPWLLIPDPAGPVGTLQPTPPDGAACGVIAAREIARRAWVAPANLPLVGVLDLQPALSEEDWASLFALNFNLVREEVKDFRVMSAHTLADDASLLQLSVRRMLIQLRKAALLRGQDYVFEKNDDVFRQRVRHGLEDLLGFMFDGGAFAGATRASSYRITVDDSLNTPGDVDQGRLIAQILVAPSQPMEFVTVLLTRSGEGGLQAVET
jgi:hypothetical protein